MNEKDMNYYVEVSQGRSTNVRKLDGVDILGPFKTREQAVAALAKESIVPGRNFCRILEPV